MQSSDRRSSFIAIWDGLADREHSMISYPNYKFTFPIKALGIFAKRYGNPKLM